MVSQRLTLFLVATALSTASALAQTSTQPTPSAGAQSTPAANSGQFLTTLGREQLRASRVVGVNIYGPNDERVGDVNEVILDRSGNAVAVVIGVGGFLGIGEKDVAIPYRMVEWTFGDTSAGTGNRGTANTGAASSTAPTTATTAGNPPNTAGGTGTEGHNVPTASRTGGTAGTDGSAGTTRSTGTAGGSTDGSGAYQGYPTRGTIRLTRDNLQNAPTFTYTNDRPADRPQGDRPAAPPSSNAPRQ